MSSSAARERDVAALAAALRGQLVERRREEAAAGRGGGDLVDTVHELVAAEAAVLGAEDRDELAERVVRDSVGLGPLEELLADPEVEEVMVNGPESIYVERG